MGVCCGGANNTRGRNIKGKDLKLKRKHTIEGCVYDTKIRVVLAALYIGDIYFQIENKSFK